MLRAAVLINFQMELIPSCVSPNSVFVGGCSKYIVKVRSDSDLDPAASHTQLKLNSYLILMFSLDVLSPRLSEAVLAPVTTVSDTARLLVVLGDLMASRTSGKSYAAVVKGNQNTACKGNLLIQQLAEAMVSEIPGGCLPADALFCPWCCHGLACAFHTPSKRQASPCSDNTSWYSIKDSRKD